MQVLGVVWLSEVMVRGVLTVTLQAWIVLLMWKRKLIRRFPIFFGYVLYQMAEGAFRWVVEGTHGTGSRQYYYGYWSTEVIEIVLLFLALGESCWHLFGRLRVFRWFWWALIGSIGAAVTYATVAAWVAPPKGVSRSLALFTELDLIAIYIPIGVGILYFFIILRYEIRGFARETGIIAGLSVASGAEIFMTGLRAYLGVKSYWATAWIAPWGYVLAEVLWVKEFLREEEPGLTPEQRERLESRLPVLLAAIDASLERLKKAVEK